MSDDLPSDEFIDYVFDPKPEKSATIEVAPRPFTDLRPRLMELPRRSATIRPWGRDGGYVSKGGLTLSLEEAATHGDFSATEDCLLENFPPEVTVELRLNQHVVAVALTDEKGSGKFTIQPGMVLLGSSLTFLGVIIKVFPGGGPEVNLDPEAKLTFVPLVLPPEEAPEAKSMLMLGFYGPAAAGGYLVFGSGSVNLVKDGADLPLTRISEEVGRTYLKPLDDPTETVVRISPLSVAETIPEEWVDDPGQTRGPPTTILVWTENLGKVREWVEARGGTVSHHYLTYYSEEQRQEMREEANRRALEIYKVWQGLGTEKNEKS